MKKLLLLLTMALALAVFAPAPPSFAQSDTTLKVVEASVATGIEDQAPVGQSNSFPADVERLWCYSKIIGSDGNASIMHRWYFGDRLMAAIPLKVKSSPFRTHSSKNILQGWRGSWRVDITTADGDVLKTVNFTVE